MNIRILKVDNSGIEYQLSRIADMLERLIYATNPPEFDSDVEDTPESRVFYTDDIAEIVANKVRQAGRTYRPRK